MQITRRAMLASASLGLPYLLSDEKGENPHNLPVLRFERGEDNVFSVPIEQQDALFENVEPIFVLAFPYLRIRRSVRAWLPSEYAILGAGYYCGEVEAQLELRYELIPCSHVPEHLMHVYNSLWRRADDCYYRSDYAGLSIKEVTESIKIPFNVVPSHVNREDLRKRPFDDLVLTAIKSLKQS